LSSSIARVTSSPAMRENSQFDEVEELAQFFMGKFTHISAP
jgi:hypothetical protein